MRIVFLLVPVVLSATQAVCEAQGAPVPKSVSCDLYTVKNGEGADAASWFRVSVQPVGSLVLKDRSWAIKAPTGQSAGTLINYSDRADEQLYVYELMREGHDNEPKQVAQYSLSIDKAHARGLVAAGETVLFWAECKVRLSGTP